MSAAHTPGPWGISGGALRIVGRHDWIATVMGASPENGLSPTDAVALANARLIAAAPELLAALRACVAAIEDADPDEEVHTDACAALGAARAAIAAAEGQS